VLEAKLEVELGSLKAMATYLAADGTYLVTDKALLDELSKVGRHAMVLTLLAGSESDLLDANLTIASAAKVPVDSAWRFRTGIAALLVVLLGAALFLWRRRTSRRQRSGAFL
jgi:nitrate reductase gamma subunit